METNRVKRRDLQAKYGLQFVEVMDICLDTLGFSYEEFMKYNRWSDTPNKICNILYYNLIKLLDFKFIPEIFVTSKEMMIDQCITFLGGDSSDIPQEIYNKLVVLLLLLKGYSLEHYGNNHQVLEFITIGYTPFLRLLATDYPCLTMLELGLSLQELQTLITQTLTIAEPNTAFDLLLAIY